MPHQHTIWALVQVNFINTRLLIHFSIEEYYKTYMHLNFKLPLFYLDLLDYYFLVFLFLPFSFSTVHIPHFSSICKDGRNF